MVFGMMMVSLCTQYWQLILAQGIVVGIGGGCLFVPSVAILPTYFSTRMAFTIGVAGSGSGIGESCYPETSILNKATYNAEKVGSSIRSLSRDLW